MTEDGRNGGLTPGRMLRGTAAGLEFVFSEGAFDVASASIVARLDDRPEFYRGSQAAIILEQTVPEASAVREFMGAVVKRGIDVRGVYGAGDARELATRIAVPYLGEPPRTSVASIARKRAARGARTAEFSAKARSLDADFAGARADIASRRARGETSVALPDFSGPAAVGPPRAAPATLYHRGTLRGGRSLHHVGTIVVVGDVNPGAELVASGDIVVFGALRGTAHAGAQGDADARVYALELVPTQLRIATLIASGDAGSRPRGAETAFVSGERIAIAPLGEAEFGR